MGSLKGQNVVVVGGSRGVGRSIVEAALERRRKRACRRPRRGSFEGTRLGSVRREDACRRRHAGHRARRGVAAMRPDVLVICAGAYAPSASIQDQSWDDFSANWETDVKASLLFCKAALQGRLKPGSRVVLISSGAALSGGPPNSGGYSGAKRMQMFLAAHSQKEADRLGLGLRFMALAPMRIMTGTGVGQRGIIEHLRLSRHQPGGFPGQHERCADPADVGRAVVALAGGKAQGTAFTVSGSGLAAAA